MIMKLNYASLLNVPLKFPNVNEIKSLSLIN